MEKQTEIKMSLNIFPAALSISHNKIAVIYSAFNVGITVLFLVAKLAEHNFTYFIIILKAVVNDKNYPHFRKTQLGKNTFCSDVIQR